MKVLNPKQVKLWESLSNDTDLELKEKLIMSSDDLNKREKEVNRLTEQIIKLQQELDQEKAYSEKLETIIGHREAEIDDLRQQLYPDEE